MKLSDPGKIKVLLCPLSAPVARIMPADKSCLFVVLSLAGCANPALMIGSSIALPLRLSVLLLDLPVRSDSIFLLKA